MTPDLVSREDVRAMLESRLPKSTRTEIQNGAYNAIEVALIYLDELPSVSVPSGEAVAWQRRLLDPRFPFQTWKPCEEDEFLIGRREKHEYRALCVISDTPPGEK